MSPRTHAQRSNTHSRYLARVHAKISLSLWGMFVGSAVLSKQRPADTEVTCSETQSTSARRDGPVPSLLSVCLCHMACASVHGSSGSSRPQGRKEGRVTTNTQSCTEAQTRQTNTAARADFISINIPYSNCIPYSSLSLFPKLDSSGDLCD